MHAHGLKYDCDLWYDVVNKTLEEIMKKALTVILVGLLVFSFGLPAAVGAPEGFDMLMLNSEGMQVFLIQMRLRDLGYLNYRPTGQYFAMTQSAVQDFQQFNELDADGRLGMISYDKLFSNEAVRKPLGTNVAVKSGPSLTGTASATGELADWATVVDAAFPVGSTATVTDYNSDKSFTVKRTGGKGHADVETVDSDAYSVFLDCYGGEPTWEKRSVLVQVGSSVYAASLFGNPAGEDTISDNGMAGHVCLYFYGSTSDVFGFVDKEHQKLVLRAAGQPMEY